MIKILDSTLREGEQTPGVYFDVHIKAAIADLLDEVGVDIIDVTVLGLGERAGLVDLGSLLSVLACDFNEDGQWKLKKIPELYRLVSRYADIAVPVNFPITGKNAFTHCAGVHTQAAIKDPLYYQSIEAGIVGREPEISLDHMSGIAAVKYCLEAIGEGEQCNDPDFVATVLAKVKEVGQRCEGN